MRGDLRCFVVCLAFGALLCVSGARAESVPIAEVRVIGDESLPLDEIRRMVSISVGGSLDEAGLARLSRRLDDLGFVRATVELLPMPGSAPSDGEILELRVERVPFVTDVSFEGLFPIFNRTALNTLRMRPGDVLDREGLDDEVQRLVALAEREGFFGTTCEATLEAEATDFAIVYRCARGRLLSSRVEAHGASALSTEEIESALSTWFFFTREHLDEKVEELVQRYRELGYVRARVRVTAVEPRAQEGVVVIRVEIEEGARLDVAFSGNVHLDDGDLREELTFIEEGGHGFFLVEAGAEAMRAAYQEAGYPEARVEFDRESGDEVVKVRYRIEEGLRADLAGIRFTGNEHMSDDRLQRVVVGDSRRWWVLAPRWSQRRLEQDRVALETFYRERGFARVQVAEAQLEHVGDEQDARVVARFDVIEGPTYRLVEVDVVGDVLGEAQVLSDALATARTLEAGQVYRAGAVRAQEVAFEKALQSKGYLTARVDRSETMHDEQGEVVARFEVTSGPRYEAGPVLIMGTRYTSDSVIHSANEIHEGEVLTPTALAETHEKLRELEVFDSIRIRLLGLGKQADGVPVIPVVVQVRESDRIQLDLGFGYDSDRGGAIRFTAAHGNLFGRAMRLSGRGTLGERDREAGLALAYPRVLGTDFTGSLRAAYHDRDLEAFDEEQLTLSTALTRDLSWDLVASIGISYRLTDVTDVTGDDPDAPEAGFSRALLWRAGLIRDTRDNVLYPSDGSYLALATALSSTRLVSDDDFVRIDVHARRYWTLIGEWVGVLSGRFTDVELYGETDTVPTPELLFAGGANSVRGFEEDRLGPLDAEGEPLGGGARIIANAELRFPLFWILDGAAFVDAGSVVRRLGDLSFDEVSVTAGGGIRARSPVGPIRFDLGYQLQENVPLDRWQLHFSFGFPF